MTILHLVESIEVGGIEKLLKNTLPLLKEYTHIVCYMKSDKGYERDFCVNKIVCLKHQSLLDLPKSIFKIRRLCKNYNVSIIHAHHFWPSILARFAKLNGVKLVSTFHSIMSKDAFEKNINSLYLEKLSVRLNDYILFVSNAVRADYLSYINTSINSSVIYNYVPILENVNRNQIRNIDRPNKFRIVSVGGIKEVKNYDYVIEAFKFLKNVPISLDVYGDGPDIESLRLRVEAEKINVKFLGLALDINSLLPNYNFFLQASVYEGFPLALAEAMSFGLKPILSDIPAHREMCANFATYFSNRDPENLSIVLMELFNSETSISLEFSKRIISHANTLVSKDTYLSKLKNVYESLQNNLI